MQTTGKEEPRMAKQTNQATHTAPTHLDTHTAETETYQMELSQH